MKMTIQLIEARQLGPNVWSTRFDPGGANVFRGSPKRFGDTTVVLLDDEPGFNAAEQTLSFPLSAATLLNVGHSWTAVIINGTAEYHRAGSDRKAEPKGDEHFIEALPPKLMKLGKKLLSEVRKFYDGQLIFHANSKKYVETQNFWTVRIQPRDVSLRVTVYGGPDSYAPQSNSLKLKADMSSYSTFKIEGMEQLESAVDVIRQAYEMKLTKMRKRGLGSSR